MVSNIACCKLRVVKLLAFGSGSCTCTTMFRWKIMKVPRNIPSTAVAQKRTQSLREMVMIHSFSWIFHSPVFPCTILKTSSERSACSRRLIRWKPAIPPLCMNYITSKSARAIIRTYTSWHTISFPYVNGWQLSKDKEPVVVARTCPLTQYLFSTIYRSGRRLQRLTRQAVIWSSLLIGSSLRYSMPDMQKISQLMVRLWWHGTRTGETEVNIQGWLPSSSSWMESYQPEPLSPKVVLKWFRKRLTDAKAVTVYRPTMVET